MATNTYVALDKITANGSVSQVTFTSIPTTYTHLMVVVNGNASYGSPDRTTLALRVGNGSLDTSSIYSHTGVYGNGSTSSSSRGSNLSYIFTGVISEKNGTTLINLQYYSNTTTFKTILTRGNSLGSTASQDVGVNSGLWRSTSAINTIQIYVADGTNFASGSTFSLYGIAAKPVSGTAKATGGTITYDSQGNTYHTFTSSGTFTPTQALDCEVLVIAGGGSGGNNKGGGGGAGGFVSGIASLGVSGYTVTVGGGGSNNTNGSNSTFNGLTAIGGGYGGTYTGTEVLVRHGNRGGSGGGGSTGDVSPGGSWGPGTDGQGYRGGSGVYSTSGSGYNAAGGGGGAAAVGANGATGQGGNGGSGSNAFASWATATSTGASGYYAGGGGGGTWGGTAGSGGAGGGGNGSTTSSPTSGTANTGGGGGGVGQASATGGSGGSGIVIIRY